MGVPKAVILLIGSELTEGRLLDRNGKFLSEELTELGFFVQEMRILPDDAALLRIAMQEVLGSEARVILSSGGLGHTSDDLTAALWAEALEDSLHFSSEIFAVLRQELEKRGISHLPYLEKYAMRPQRGEVLMNPVGLAPALYWEKGLQVICALPGPPSELQAIWHEHLKKRLLERFSPQSPLHYTLRTTGISESRLSALIEPWEKTLPPSHRLSYNPSWEGVTLHVYAPPASDMDVFEGRIRELRTLLQPYIYAEGNIPLAQALLHRLKQADFTLAIAESCTGGHVAAKIVNIPGASEVLLGGIISYANSAKMQLLGVSPEALETEGAVSKTVALQMAEGVRKAFGADVGIATTGIAGPTGGSPEKPVGTVWIAVATPTIQEARRYLFPGDREAVIERATATALSFLWQILSPKV
ncbi:MAG: nicotinamide-nucleotide amidohydrolase family protein [Bacteroidia bacterium]|nr:nicotinamide-nucleotide amidohydrolase family protein [Bacteroidia bacterium]MDW8057442.1 nicotinamide-nucleotide amidohydrolase family protein [Bacteroidia bacterium]